MKNPATLPTVSPNAEMIGIDFLSLFGKTTLLRQRGTVRLCHEGWPRDW